MSVLLILELIIAGAACCACFALGYLFAQGPTQNSRPPQRNPPPPEALEEINQVIVQGLEK